VAGRVRQAYSSPVSASAQFERVDQGVDYLQSSPYRAVAAGTITHTSPPGSWAGGTGEAVYEHLDQPVTVDGRTYSDVYYAEEHPLVQQGQRVRAGDPVMEGGGSELGFARGTSPAAPLVGGLGAGTQATQAGQDFLAFVRGGGSAQPGLPPDYGAPANTMPTARAPSGAVAAPGTLRPPRPSSGGVLGFLGSTGDALEGAASQAWKFGVNAVEGPMKIVLAALWLLKPSNWLRMVEFLAGMGLVVLGLVGLAVSLLAKSDLAREAAAGAAAAPGPVGALGKAVTATGTRKGRRNLARSAGERATREQRETIRHAESQPTSRRVRNMRRRMVSHTLEVDRKPERSTSTRSSRDSEDVVIPF